MHPLLVRYICVTFIYLCLNGICKSLPWHNFVLSYPRKYPNNPALVRIETQVNSSSILSFYARFTLTLLNTLPFFCESTLKFAKASVCHWLLDGLNGTYSSVSQSHFWLVLATFFCCLAASSTLYSCFFYNKLDSREFVMWSSKVPQKETRTTREWQNWDLSLAFWGTPTQI